MAIEQTDFQPFAGFPSSYTHAGESGKIKIIGIPHCVAYPGERAHSATAPAAIRRESNRFAGDAHAWDFDLNGTLADICGNRALDCGDLATAPNQPEENTRVIEAAIKEILSSDSVPVVLGGDDSVPIPVLRAYRDQAPFQILQLDAHIDWRDAVGGVADGYSSTMRRASELPWVQEIIQIGARGVGSAREEERKAALAYGARLIPAREFHFGKANEIPDLIPQGSRTFFTIDFDVLDPAIMPAVGAPTPGGFLYQETIDLIHAIASRSQIVGVCLVELVPESDLNNIGVITAMRIAWNMMGAIAKSKETRRSNA